MLRRLNAIHGAVFFTLIGAAPAALADGGAGGPAPRANAAAVAAPSSTAASKPPSAAELASARRLFAVALSAEDRGRWAEALEAYERVGRIVTSPSLRYHMGVCHEALGHLVEAVNAFELAASSAAARRDSALAGESRSRLEKLRAKTAQMVLRVPDDAEDVRIELDGELLNAALAGAAVLVAPGDRRLVVRARNYTDVFDATLSAHGGEMLEVRAELGSRRRPLSERPRLPQRPAVAPRIDPAPSRAPAFLVGGAALALTAGAVATGIAAYDVRATYLRENADPAPGSLPKRQALHDEGQALAITSTALTGGAVLAGAIAAYLFWPSSADRSSSAASPKAALSPWAGPGAGGIHVRGVL